MPTRAERRGARANSRTTRSGNGTSSTSGRAESVIDRVAGSAPDPWAEVERRARGEKAEEEDEDKMYRLELACSFE